MIVLKIFKHPNEYLFRFQRDQQIFRNPGQNETLFFGKFFFLSMTEIKSATREKISLSQKLCLILPHVPLDQLIAGIILINR